MKTPKTVQNLALAGMLTVAGLGATGCQQPKDSAPLTPAERKELKVLFQKTTFHSGEVSEEEQTRYETLKERLRTQEEVNEILLDPKVFEEIDKRAEKLKGDTPTTTTTLSSDRATSATITAETLKEAGITREENDDISSTILFHNPDGTAKIGLTSLMITRGTQSNSLGTMLVIQGRNIENLSTQVAVICEKMSKDKNKLDKDELKLVTDERTCKAIMFVEEFSPLEVADKLVELGLLDNRQAAIVDAITEEFANLQKTTLSGDRETSGTRKRGGPITLGDGDDTLTLDYGNHPLGAIDASRRPKGVGTDRQPLGKVTPTPTPEKQ